MKLFLEEEQDTIDEKGESIKGIKFVKEVLNKEQAIKDKSKTKKSYIHKCYHDEENPRPCKREVI